MPYVSERKTRGRSRLLTLRVWLNDARRHQLDERDVLPAQQRWQNSVQHSVLESTDTMLLKEGTDLNVLTYIRKGKIYVLHRMKQCIE